MDLVLILILALAIDLIIGEYPGAIHPTVWAGRLAGALIRPGFRLSPSFQLFYGSIVSLAIIVIFALTAWLLLDWLEGINYWLYIGAGALILKPAFCLALQWQVAEKTRVVIESEAPVPPKMKGLFDTVSHGDAITRSDIVSSGIRSIAENASDFVTAPLFYYVFLGVPGAMAYRVINTMDNMIGYHGRFEHLGKFAARLDDVVSFIPSRITAVLIVLSAGGKRLDISRAWRTMLADHDRTPGPNGGWPMAAVAGALGVRLCKAGYYEVGCAFGEPSPNKISEAVGLYRMSMFTWISVCFGALVAPISLRG